MLTAVIATALAVYNDCPDQPDGCGGTAVARSQEAMARARAVDLNRSWKLVRDDIVRACGLRVQQSTTHCFNDWNHVDCCTMESASTHRTNQESRVAGMHAVNFLGTHIVDASVTDLGSGGSWCTCHISSPEDVCHRQFGSRTAFKLVWCSGSGVAALLDDYGNVLSSGKPIGSGSSGVPTYGGAGARQQSWHVLSASRNHTWAGRWLSACDRVSSGSSAYSDSIADDGTGGLHDEL